MGGATRVNSNSLWAIAGMILTSPLFFIFNDRGEPGTGRAAWICSGMIFIAVKMRWKFKARPLFWITVVGLSALHVPLILFVPWTNRWIPAIAILPLGVADLVLILSAISLVMRTKNGLQSSDKNPRG